MKRTSRAVAAALPLVVALLLLCGFDACNDGTATISYKQVGACNGWNDGTLHSAGPNAAYVVFKVHSIDNTQGKVDFAFDPSKMGVNVGGHPHMDSSLSLAKFIGVFQLVSTTIPKGNLVGLDGYSVTIVPTANSNGAVEANQTSYPLTYDTGNSDPGIIFSNHDSGRTSWPLTEDCKSISY